MDDSLRIRIFDKEFDQYINPDETDYYIDSNGRVILEIERITENGVFELKEFDITEADDLYRIERCTGLRDKNGLLIFEGDILQYTDKNGCKIQQEVIWDDRKARFAHVVDWGIFDRTISPLDQELCSQKEIVGNIHEVE